jgi:hypothetical protein
MNKRAYDIKSADLDRLERELGLIGDEDESQIKHSTEGQVIPSVRPSERRAGGCISSLWLCGIFGGCVPALYSCWLADWAILQGDRYAGMLLLSPLLALLLILSLALLASPGIFFTAAFFGIYSDALQSMDGANIRKWIDKVLSGEPNWFSLLRLPLSAQNSGKAARDFLSDDLEEDTGAQVTWESFTRGWIHTAASEFPLSLLFSPPFLSLSVLNAPLHLRSKGEHPPGLHRGIRGHGVLGSRLFRTQ